MIFTFDVNLFLDIDNSSFYMRRDIKVIFTDYTISVTHLSFYLEVNKKAKHVLLLKLRMITTPSASNTNQNKNAEHASNVCSSQLVNKWRHEYLPVCTYPNTITKGRVPSVDTVPCLQTIDCSKSFTPRVSASPATGCTVDYQIYVY